MKTLHIVSVFLLALCFPHLLRADDSAASVALGGIQLKREARISMKKERLFISQKLVKVEFEFLNSSSEDITTEVAFPIPEYELDLWSAGGMRPFNDFRVRVDGKELKYSIDAKAIYKDKDVTAILKQYKVDIASFAHCDQRRIAGRVDDFSCPDYDRLSIDAKKELRGLGLFSNDQGPDEEPLAQWKVRKYYHWTQTFPAGKTVHIRHLYAPALGFTPIHVNDLNTHSKIAELDAACIEPGLQRGVTAAMKKRTAVRKQSNGDYLGSSWVDYILTTANSWKTPIEDFELIIEKSSSDGFVSFCWEGNVQRLDATHFRTHLENFVPRRELHVVFLEP